MKTKIFTVIILSSLFFNTALALTQEDIDLLIAAGFIPKENAAQARSAISGTNTSTSNTSSSQTSTQSTQSKTNSTQTSCLKLTTDLSNGMSSVDVTYLQNFLKAKGHLSANATGYFGNMTQSAVEKFQKIEGIVLNGTPETTGLGKVGPATRTYIEQLTCGTVSGTKKGNTLFGYDLSQLLDYKSNTEYSSNLNYKSNINYKSNLSYTSNLDYNSDLDYDSDIEDYQFFEDYDAGVDDYKADINYTTGSSSKALLYVKALNGEFLRGGNKLPVAVKSADIELAWVSANAYKCTLSGDFKEKKLDVPVEGSARLTMTVASRKAANGDPMFAFNIYCPATTTAGYVLNGSDTALVWIAPANATTTTQ